MNREGSIVTIAAAIFLSWFVFRKSFNKNPKKRGIQPPTTDDSSTASASKSSTAADLAGQYEVFLSFRGTDTRQGFTDFLYTYLVGAGICTFRDDNELRIGEEIGPDLHKAIKESKISIPIFSKDYASSKWCLRELAQIVECHANDGQKIFPIFYDVDASDVRNQRGSYEKAFRQHKKNFDEKTVQEWREALKIVGELKGYELENETHGHEGELVKMVIETVVFVLKKNFTHVPDNLVGMDHHVGEMERLLNVNSNGVRIVGIHGMGGIGKTTISKVIYNRLCERFESCCFLDDVRERSQHHGVVVLQNELVSKILKQKFTGINNADEGINKIKDVAHRKKVLLVLDDIDGISQFDKLVGKCNWFGVGSRIVVTTRNKDILDTLEVTCEREGQLEGYKSYEPQLMNDDHSLQLFSKYAFKRDLPPEDYNILSKDVISTAAGLPLVLVTIGSLLFGKEDKALWEEILRKLQRIPHKEVVDKLRISFEALDHEQKQIFLDIACLFIGENTINPFYMWDDCEFYPRSGIKVLVLRSLVKIQDDNSLWMHDHLRDLGRQIVREESLNEPGERSRLWRHDEALELLQRRMVTKRVVSLDLDVKLGNLGYPRLVGETFWQLPNLRFLNVGDADLDGDFHHILSNLRWLKWRCPANCMPTNCHFKNLVILDLSDSEFSDEWEGWNEIKMAKKLKYLNLTYCYQLTRAPHLSTFSSLERLDLRYCRGLEEIGPSIGNQKNLRVLDLSSCWGLRILDCSMFGNLESLNIQYCNRLPWIVGLESLESLRHLNMIGCRSLVRLPDLSNFKKLKKLEIQGCVKLTEIQGLDKLESLEHLDMENCKFIEKLPDLSNLKMLIELDLCKCKKLSEVEGLRCLESLAILDVSYFKPFEENPDLSNFKNLKKLRFGGFTEITEIRGLEELKSLEVLNICGCRSVEKLPDFSAHRNLKEINVSYCEKLTEIKGLEELKSLALLEINGCKSLENLPHLPNTRISQLTDKTIKDFLTRRKHLLQQVKN